MGALYEDVENFFGDIFAWYGKLVARFPFIFTIVPLLTCIVFGFGLFNIHYETNIENLYSPINSDAQKDRQLLKTLFDFHYHHHYQSSKILKSHANSTGHEQQKSAQQNDKKLDFRFHQQIHYPAYIEIIIFNKRRKNDSTSTGNSTSACNNIFSKLSNQSKNDSENCQFISFEDQKNVEDSTNVNELFENLTEFSPETWMAIQLLYHSIATQKGPKNPSFNYSNVCAKLGDVCAVDIFELPDDKTACMFPKQSYSPSGPYIKYQPSKSFGKKLPTTKPPRTTTSSEFITSTTPTNQNTTNNPTRYFPPSTGSSQISYLPPLIISTSAKAVKLRFNLRGETHGMGRQKHLRWQDSTLDHLKRFKSSIINIAFVASDSLEIELRDHVGGDTKYFALSVVAMLVSATLAGNGGSLDHVVLAYTGVVAALLAILGAFGLLSLAGASFVNLCSVMPFLVLGIGVDDMLQLLVEWRKTLSQEERLSGTLRSAAVSITITSLTDLLAFCIGATSPFLSVRNFCACSGVGIFLCYVNQLTFFSGCIVLISRQCKRKRNSQKTQKLQTEPNSHPDRKTTADSSTTTTTIAELQEADDEVPVERPKNKRQDHVTKSSINSDDSRSSNNDPSGSVKVPCTKSTAGSPKGDGMIGRKRDSMFTTLVADVLTSVPIENRHSSEDIIHNETSIAAENNKEIDVDVYQIVDCCGRMRSCYERRDGTMERFKSTVRTGICESFSRIFIKYYPKILLHWIGKTVTVIFYIAYVGLSIHGVANLEEGLNLEALVPPEYYYRRHAEIDSKFFPNCGIIVTFFIHQPITYHEFHTQERLQAFMKSLETSDFVSPGSTIFWLEEFLGYLATSDKDKLKKRRMDEVEFARKLQKDFFIKHPEFVGDVVFSKQTKTPSYIEASRLYAVCHRTNSSEWEKDLMLEMRRLANNSSLPMKAFSPHFVFYEHYASIVKNALLPVGVTIIGMLFVALVFIPHPIAVTCVIGSMASVVVGMMGFMQLCGLALSAITTMQIILGVGICVSFTVRTNHAFMTATGKSRNERVTSALTKVGVSILTGAACSVLSASALYYGSSFIFASFFKTTAFALLLGVLHSLVFLPVMLSFVGPRRTSKPRLFIPVTPTSPEPTGSPNCPLIDRDRHPSEDSTKSKSSNSSSRKSSNETSSRHPLSKNRSTSIEQYRDEIDSSSKGGKSQRVSFKLEETNMKEMTSSKEKQNEPKQKSMSKAACAQTNF